VADRDEADAGRRLHNVGTEGAIRRGISVLKMRGSEHAKELREYVITDTGMHVGEPFGARLCGDAPQLL
jgi:KaiC/GvpD/RAD55 family RecA-like ATPase